MAIQALPHGLETDLEIYQADLQRSKNGKSVFLQIGFNVMSAQYQRRRVWHKFFIEGAPKPALDVSAQLYWQMLDAIGFNEESEPVSTVPGIYQKIVIKEYLGLKVRGRIKLKSGSNGFADSNEISLFNTAINSYMRDNKDG